MKRLFLLWQCILWIGSLASCQQSSISGIYGGVKLRISSMIGGGMERDDNVLYLRSDGTFTEDLEDPNWKTTVMGTYTVKGKEVILTYAKDNDQSTYKISPKGYLTDGQYNLFKMHMDQAVPKGSFKYTGGSGGGGLSGIPYVGSFSQDKLAFDGKGNFSHRGFSTVSIAGDNIGGGSSHGEEGDGTYSYEDGTLTLHYRDGRDTTHSLFFTQGDDEPLLALDGSIYVVDKDKEDDLAKAKRESLSAPELLKRVREAHGGTAIDAVRNLKLVAQDQHGATMLILADHENARGLLEMRVAGKLIVAEYYDQQGGWQWIQGKKNPLTKQRMDKIRLNPYVGLNGLKKKHIEVLSKGQVASLEDGYALSYEVNGQPLKLITDKRYRIVGEEKPSSLGTVNVMLNRLREVDGVLLPFLETQVVGDQKIEFRVTDYFINQVEEKEWGSSL